MEILGTILGLIGRALTGVLGWVGRSADEAWFWYAVVAGIVALVLFRLWQNAAVRMVVVFVAGILIALLVTGGWRP